MKLWMLVLVCTPRMRSAENRVSRQRVGESVWNRVWRTKDNLIYHFKSMETLEKDVVQLTAFDNLRLLKWLELSSLSCSRRNRFNQGS